MRHFLKWSIEVTMKESDARFLAKMTSDLIGCAIGVEDLQRIAGMLKLFERKGIDAFDESVVYKDSSLYYEGLNLYVSANFVIKYKDFELFLKIVEEICEILKYHSARRQVHKTPLVDQELDLVKPLVNPAYTIGGNYYTIPGTTVFADDKQAAFIAALKHIVKYFNIFI